MNNELGAAINIPPNVSRFLMPWGLDPVKARLVTSKGMKFKSFATLEDLAFHDHSKNLDIYGAPLYYSHRVDLHESLKRMATGPEGPGIPAKVHLKSEVSKFVSMPHSTSAPLVSVSVFGANKGAQGPRRIIHHPSGRNRRDWGSCHCRRWHSFHCGGGNHRSRQPTNAREAQQLLLSIPHQRGRT